MKAKIISIDDVTKEYKIWTNPIGKFFYYFLSPLNLADGLLRGFYKTFKANDAISFDIFEGERIGLIGLNGSGKSTLLQMIAGTLLPTRGEVLKKGRVAALLELGAGFNNEFTGRENVYLNGALYGLSKREIDDRFDLIKDFSGIGDFMDRPVKSYSSGMVVRLAFSIISQINPDVLIVDEALAVGDVLFQHKCIKFIKEFAEDGGTLLFVSHDASTVKTLCDRAIFIDKGVVKKMGTPEEVYNFYNAYISGEDLSQASDTSLNNAGLTTESGTREVFFENISIVNEALSAVDNIEIGEDVFLSLKLKAVKSMEGLSVGFTIRDRLGNDVFGTNTYELGFPAIGIVEEASKEIRFKLTCHLGVGSYSLSVAVHKERDHLDSNFHWIDHAKVFRVINSKQHHSVGVARLPVEVSVNG